MKNEGSYLLGVDVPDICRKTVGTKKIMEVVYAVANDVNCILTLSLTFGAELVSFNKTPQLCGCLLHSF